MKRFVAVFLTVMAVLLGFYLAHPLILEGMGKYLVVQDKLEKADAIVVLPGDWSGERVTEGANLFKQGYAKYMVFTSGVVYRKTTLAQFMKEHALGMGIPPAKILIAERSWSTRDDSRLALAVAQKRKFKSVILVTSPYHTRRAAASFRKTFGPAGIKVLVYPVQQSEFNPQRWWTRREDAEVVAKEYISMLVYFIRGE